MQNQFGSLPLDTDSVDNFWVLEQALEYKNVQQFLIKFANLKEFPCCQDNNKIIIQVEGWEGDTPGRLAGCWSADDGGGGPYSVCSYDK